MKVKDLVLVLDMGIPVWISREDSEDRYDSFYEACRSGEISGDEDVTYLTVDGEGVITISVREV